MGCSSTSTRGRIVPVLACAIHPSAGEFAAPGGLRRRRGPRRGRAESLARSDHRPLQRERCPPIVRPGLRHQPGSLRPRSATSTATAMSTWLRAAARLNVVSIVRNRGGGMFDSPMLRATYSPSYALAASISTWTATSTSWSRALRRARSRWCRPARTERTHSAPATAARRRARAGTRARRSGQGCLSSLGTAERAARARSRASLSADTRRAARHRDAELRRAVLPGHGASSVASAWSSATVCAARWTIVRLGIRSNARGASQYPDRPISRCVARAVGAPGDALYQVWYRNAAAFCSRDVQPDERLARRTVPNIIGGEEKPAAGADTLDKLNPHNGELVCSVTRSRTDDVASAVTAADQSATRMGRSSRSETWRDPRPGCTCTAPAPRRDGACRCSRDRQKLQLRLRETDAAIALGFFMAAKDNDFTDAPRQAALLIVW